MGAVQKLATVVIVGLVALASALVVYLADEPNRRAAEAAEQEEVAIERAIETYTVNCVQCHGPGGEGLEAGDGRIGFPLGGNTELARAQQELNQSEDPIERQERYDLIVETLHEGRGEQMPAWGRGAEGGALLNDEQIHELAVMIQNVDWDVVYNHIVEETAERMEAEGTPVPEIGAVYPTAPPQTPSAAAQEAAQDEPAAATPDQQQPADGTAGAPPPAAAAPSVTIEAADIKWIHNGEESGPNRPITVPVAPGTTITVPNVGAITHNFRADDFGIDEDIAVGATVEVQIPADAAPGDYPFICDIPGHEAAMSGILQVGAAAAVPPPPLPPKRRRGGARGRRAGRRPDHDRGRRHLLGLQRRAERPQQADHRPRHPRRHDLAPERRRHRPQLPGGSLGHRSGHAGRGDNRGPDPGGHGTGRIRLHLQRSRPRGGDERCLGGRVAAPNGGKRRRGHAGREPGELRVLADTVEVVIAVVMMIGGIFLTHRVQVWADRAGEQPPAANVALGGAPDRFEERGLRR